MVRDLHYLGVRATLLLLGALLIAFGAASSARADDPSDLMYDPTTVNVIDLTLSPENEEALENEPEEYVEGTFAMATTDGTPAGEQPPLEPARPVEIRLKGSASFKPLTGKAAFKLKFKKVDAFLGLRKMTLNNMVEDRSLIHETLTYHLFRSAGVPASRTGYAYLRVNGVDYGIYMNIESLDKVALEKRFGPFDENVQHLYEAEYDVDVTSDKLAEFEIDEGDGPPTDLEALIAAVNGAGPDWSDQVATTADLSEMTEMWAIEKYVGQGDGYAGREGGSQPNNYYLYSDLTGRFQMLPWGTDETWEERLDFDGPAGVMFNKCLADASCAALYRQQLVALKALLPSLGLTALAEDTADLVRPWKEVDPRLEHPEDFESSVAETLAFIAERPADLDTFLGRELPTDPSDRASGGQSTVPGVGQGGPVLLPAPLRIDSLRFLGSLVVVNVDAPGSGVVFKRVTGRTKRGWGAACTGQVPAARAGHLTLRCRLSAGFRRKLKSGPLLLKIWVGFQPNAGAPSSASRLVTAPRLSKR